MRSMGLTTALKISVAFVFLASVGTVTCVLHFLTFLLVSPFSLSLRRRISRALSQAFLLCSTFMLERWSSVRIITHGAEISPHLSTLCLMQHACDTDSILGLAWLGRYGFPYPGNAKCVVKENIGSIPVFGWILRFSEFIFISRSWKSDREGFFNDLDSLNEYPKPLWVVLYPEGSRFTEEKRIHSQEFSLARGYPVVKNILFPRFKAFTSIVSRMRNTFDGIADATVIFEGTPPTMTSLLAGTANCTMHAFMRYYPMKDIPEGQKELEEWLIKRWVEKDKILDSYKEDKSSIGEAVGTFEEPPSLMNLYLLCTLSGLVDMGILLLALTSKLAFQALVVCSTVSILFIGILMGVALRPSSKGTGRDHLKKG